MVELDSYFPAGSFFAALMDSAHSDCYSMKIGVISPPCMVSVGV
jgi:hypothetical protein